LWLKSIKFPFSKKKFASLPFDLSCVFPTYDLMKGGAVFVRATHNSSSSSIYDIAKFSVPEENLRLIMTDLCLLFLFTARAYVLSQPEPSKLVG